MNINNSYIFMIVFTGCTLLAKSHNYGDLNSVQNSVTSVRHYFANLLKSLVDLNEQRIKTLNQLYMLNRIDFGKILRTDKNIDYDEIIKSIATIMALLSKNDEIEYLNDDRGKAEQNNIKVARVGSDNYYDSDDEFYDESVSEFGYKSCGKPLLRCVWSCFDALERACRYEECSIDFELQMVTSCKSACLSRFYYNID